MCEANAKFSVMKIFDTYLSHRTGLGRDMAELLGVSQSAVTQVRRGKRPMPIDWMERIEKFTNGRLTVEAMVRSASRMRRQSRLARQQ